MANDEFIVYVIDDDEAVRDSMSLLLESALFKYQCFDSANAFLDYYPDAANDTAACALVDIRMPGMNGMKLQQHLKQAEYNLPIIFITGHGDIPMAVEAMRDGAIDFLRKPVREQDLLDSIAMAQETYQNKAVRLENFSATAKLFEALTPREQDVFHKVAAGLANKVIALDLNISERTVEVHRSRVMKKLNARSVADLVRIQISSDSLAKQ